MLLSTMSMELRLLMAMSNLLVGQSQLHLMAEGYSCTDLLMAVAT